MKSKDIKLELEKKKILSEIRRQDLFPRPIRDHIGEVDHGHESKIDFYPLELADGKRVSVECCIIEIGGITETLVYDIIVLNNK